MQDNMVIPIVTVNKNEHLEIKLNYENKNLEERKNNLKNSIVGAKSGLSS